MPKKYIEGIKTELNEMLNCETLNEAREKRDAIIADYSDIAEPAMVCLDEGFDDAMTVMVLPKRLRKYMRTSNHIERLNRELKRRSNVIGIFPNAESINRLMGSGQLEVHAYNHATVITALHRGRDLYWGSRPFYVPLLAICG